MKDPKGMPKGKTVAKKGKTMAKKGKTMVKKGKTMAKKGKETPMLKLTPGQLKMIKSMMDKNKE
tara:strand:+ start:921 stop:1112 length:192 start_codon:yes stop_codon:yes gene_type:complete